MPASILHDGAQDDAIIDLPVREFTQSAVMRLQPGLRKGAKEVHRGSHVKAFAVSDVEQRHIDGCAVIMHGPVYRVGDIGLLRCTFYDLPHFELDAARPQSIGNKKAKVRVPLPEQFTGFTKFFCCFGAEIGSREAFVNVTFIKLFACAYLRSTAIEGSINPTSMNPCASNFCSSVVLWGNDAASWTALWFDGWA